jgi:POT family proton-dependent oligopeptide transporter
MMAIWFLSSSWAQYIGAFIAEHAGTETLGGQAIDPRAALETSLGVFNVIGWVGVGSGVFFFLISYLWPRRAA